MITIQAFEAHHASACAHIMAENALWQRYGVDFERALLNFQVNAPADPHATVKVALSEKQVVGFIWFYVRGTFNRGAYIRLIGVDNAAKGQGVGQALMAAAEAEIRPHTCDIFLLTSDFNTDAQRFYQRLGYQSAGALPDYVQSGITEMIFWKRLV